MITDCVGGREEEGGGRGLVVVLFWAKHWLRVPEMPFFFPLGFGEWAWAKDWSIFISDLTLSDLAWRFSLMMTGVIDVLFLSRLPLPLHLPLSPHSCLVRPQDPQLGGVVV